MYLYSIFHKYVNPNFHNQMHAVGTLQRLNM